MDIKSALREHLEKVDGLVRVSVLNKMPKKNGNGVYGSGVVTIEGGENIGYKIWDETLIQRLDDLIKQYGEGCFIQFNGSGNIYNNAFNIVIEGFNHMPTERVNFTKFYPQKHEVKDLMGRVNGVLVNNTTEKAIGLIQTLLSGWGLVKRFQQEFAGRTMHDATPNGLLHHTTKMMEITELVMKQHNNFGSDQDKIDLIYVGVLLHDIGKTLEMEQGVYTQNSIATHRFLGAELLFQYKETIIELYDENWYYELITIITQHHGEYEERPRTVVAYIVHLIDNFDTRLTIVEEKIEAMDFGETQRIMDFYLRK